MAFDENGRTVGRVAKGQAAINPKRTISSVKRFIGRLRSEVAEDEKLVQYKLVGEPHEPVQVEIDGKRIFPQEITAAVLADLKKSAESFLNEKVTAAVISVPAYLRSRCEKNSSRADSVRTGLRIRQI